ncbi:MAG: PAS domain-containing protein, partial [Fibrobacterota bacterium]
MMKKTAARLAAHIRRIAFLEKTSAVAIYDRGLVFRYVNRLFADSIGYDINKILGQPLDRFFRMPYGCPRRKHRDGFRNGDHTGYRVILKLNPTDNYRRIQVPIEEEQGYSALVSLSALDDRYRFCIMTVQSYRMERTLGRQALDTFVSLDRKGRVLSFSENFSWFSGQRNSEIFGKPVERLFLHGTYPASEKGLLDARAALFLE